MDIQKEKVQVKKELFLVWKEYLPFKDMPLGKKGPSFWRLCELRNELSTLEGVERAEDLINIGRIEPAIYILCELINEYKSSSFRPAVLERLATLAKRNLALLSIINEKLLKRRKI